MELGSGAWRVEDHVGHLYSAGIGGPDLGTRLKSPRYLKNSLLVVAKNYRLLTLLVGPETHINWIVRLLWSAERIGRYLSQSHAPQL